MWNHSKSPQRFVFEVTCSQSVSIHLLSNFFSVQLRKEEGFAPPLQFLMRLCVCCMCVFVCGMYVCVHYRMHWPSNGCLIVLPWIQRDVNVENSIMSVLSLWKILNKEILMPISSLITHQKIKKRAQSFLSF